MKLFSVLTERLTSYALDFMVAKAEGYIPDPSQWTSSKWDDKRYSIDGSQGLKIVDREGISTRKHSKSGKWYAMSMDDTTDNTTVDWCEFTTRGGVRYGSQSYEIHKRKQRFEGSSLLEAALRCYLYTKFGREVEVPSQFILTLPLDILGVLWADLGDIPTVFEGEHVDEIEQEFLHFPVGTHRENIWRWFESMNEKFSVGEIMSGSHQAVVS